MKPYRHTQRIVLSWLIIGIKILVFTSTVHSDGLLSKVSSEVREASETSRHHHEDEERKAKKNKNGILGDIVQVTLSKNDSHDHHEKKRRRKRRRSRPYVSGNFGFVGYNQPACVHVPPPVYGCVPTPIVVENTYEVYEPVIQEPIPAPITSDYVPEHFEPVIPVTVDWFTAWSARLTATGGTDFEDISNFGLGLLIQPSGAIGLDTSVTTLRENGMTFRDHLWLGDVNLLFEPVATNSLRGRLGIGVNWLGDSYGGEAGFNMTGGFDLKLNDCWLVVGEGDIGTLGDADFFHGEISLVRQFEAAGLVVGYEHYDIGGINIDSFFTGLEFRF